MVIQNNNIKCNFGNGYNGDVDILFSLLKKDEEERIKSTFRIIIQKK